MESNVQEYKNVIYLKLPPYVGQFLKSIFASKRFDDILHRQIIFIPCSTELHACIKNSLIENSEFIRTKGKTSRGAYRNNNSFSMAAVRKALDVLKKNQETQYDKEKIPMKEDMPLLVPIAIPNVLWRNEAEVYTNAFFELAFNGAVSVRQMCIDFFWSALTDFIHSEKTSAIALQHKFNLTLSIEKFLVHYGIETDLFWSVYIGVKRRLF